MTNYGVVGIGKYNHKTHNKAYQKWKSMLHRVYNSSRREYPQYGGRGVSVCSEWHNFQNFCSWIVNYPKHELKGFELDKDILNVYGSLYSPATCCIVPREINTAVVGCRNEIKGFSKTDNPKKPFRVRLNKSGKVFNLGVYSTEEECFLVYDKAKRQYLSELAEKWREDIDDLVYSSLKNGYCL